MNPIIVPMGTGEISPLIINDFSGICSEFSFKDDESLSSLTSVVHKAQIKMLNGNVIVAIYPTANLQSSLSLNGPYDAQNPVIISNGIFPTLENANIDIVVYFKPSGGLIIGKIKKEIAIVINISPAWITIIREIVDISDTSDAFDSEITMKIGKKNFAELLEMISLENLSNTFKCVK